MLVRIITLIVIAALVVSAGIFSAGPLTRLGIWDYGQGLSNIRLLALPVLIVTGASFIALILAILKARGMILISLVASIVSVGAASIPLGMKAAVDANPLIHDVTTDFENPPQILVGASESRKNPVKYIGSEQAPGKPEGVTVAEAQRDAFPALKPIIISGNIDSVREITKASLLELKMEVLAEGPVSDVPGSGWRIEAVFVSQWFGFKDDFIVRLKSNSQSDVIVDVRSKSRVGLSDLGANAARIKAFEESLIKNSVS